MNTTRRKALQTGAAAAALPLVHIRTANAAGTVSVGFWDHWVPAGNAKMRELVHEWSDKNKTNVKIDFITTIGNKNLLTIAAEAQARTGHDMLAFPTWEIQNNADHLEPMDDMVKRLEAKYGKIDPSAKYLGVVKNSWKAMPSFSGSQNKPSCGRISFFKKQGMDLQSIFPVADKMGPGYDKWTWDAILDIAPKAKAAGTPFGFPMSQFTDSVDWVGALFAAFDAVLVDAEGNIKVKSDQVKQVLAYAKKLVPHLSPDVFSWDDASNNRALISNKSALIFNPPSAWAVAKRDAPQVAADCWTFPSPAGSAGRFIPKEWYFWGVWKFSKNKQAAKDLVEWLSEREQVIRLVTATSGYDIPPFESMTDFPVWKNVEPPKGTVYNYPIRPQHHSKPHIAAYPAPPEIAVQIYNRGTMTRMIARCTQGGQSIDNTVAWAQDELEGYSR